MDGKNFFEHWESDVLSGKETRSFLFALRNAHFKTSTEAEFRRQLEEWAKRHNVDLRFGHDMTAGGEVKACVFFTPHPRR